MPANNVLFIMSDEHSRRVLGAYGNSVVKTPNMDALAAAGTLFESAYCGSPICVPSRASFVTGRHVHQVGAWDNAFPYRGVPPSWAHRLRASGHRCDSIGKLHFRSSEDPNGFGNELLPLHIIKGEGDALGMIRRPPAPRNTMHHLAGDAGPGDSGYLQYDRDIRDEAIRWLHNAAKKEPERPWCLFVSFVCPHFPLVAPPEFFDLYDHADLPLPRLREPEEFPDHPVLRKMREVLNENDFFRDDDHVRTAIAAYYGMVSFLDDNIGRVLTALQEEGLAENTLVAYASDHGDNLGTRTFWGKCTMYEESAGIPLILRGPGIPAGRRVATPASLVDAYPTIIEAVGEELTSDERALPGTSLLRLIDGQETDRTIFSEYHAAGSMTGVFMVRFGHYKYVHYDGYRPQLYDLEADPMESRDLALESGHEAVLMEGERRLRAICDPAAVSRRAFEEQDRRIQELGGAEEIVRRGSVPYTPAPGEKPRIS